MSDGPVDASEPRVYGPFPDGTPYGPGGITDADDEHLRDLRRTIAEPVVTSLLTDDELGSLSTHRGVGGETGEVWVRIVAGGEAFLGFLPLWSDEELDGEGALTGAQHSAEHLASNLEDWIAESGFGWGQQRTARYVLPPA